jgi:hypothetical protein
LTVFAARAGAQVLPAFSGAEGAGSTASGGRGYEVYHVTNLNDSGPGSFRDAINSRDANGNLTCNNRIVVFDVGGTINLASTPDHLLRTGASNITIAGQTAPGNGIVIYGQGVKLTGTNVVVRNVHFRPGDVETRTRDGLWLETKDSIIDHCSTEWYTDEGISTSDAGANTTVQYCIIAEGLNYGGHSYGGLIGVDVNDTVISYHHNLFADNKSRNPRLGNETNSVNVVDFRNNALYNWSSNCGYSTGNQEGDGSFVGNYYIAGPSTTSSSKRNEAFNGGGANTGIYQSGNKIDPNRNGVFDGTDTGWAMFTGSYTKVTEEFPLPPVTTQSADDALQTVLNYSGAFWWNRDTVDARVVNEVRTGTGAIINHVSDVGGFTYYPEVHRPDGWDTDQDGMPDAWEQSYGLDPNVDDHNGDFDNDGYTNLEEYINQLGWFPPPKPIVWAGGTGRYEIITNWDIPWQPTVNDAVEINSGKAVVGYIGQEAGTLVVGNAAGGTAELAITAGKLTVGNALHVGSAAGAGGMLNVTGGSLTATGPIVLAGGTASTAELKVSKDAYVQAGGLTINSGSGRSTQVTMELDANGNSLIQTTGSATLAGPLDLQSLNSYRPDQGDTFTLIISTGMSGDFDSITTNLQGLLRINRDDPNAGYRPAFSGAVVGTDYVVTFQGARAGDATGDNRIDSSDLAALGASWLKLGGTFTWLEGDFNGDGQVDGTDLASLGAGWWWQGPWPSPAPTDAPLPEPATLVLLAMGGLALIRRRRRRL